jgi:hypothetical protein
MTNVERQPRYRTAADLLVIHYRRTAAVAPVAGEMPSQPCWPPSGRISGTEYRARLEALPDNLQEGATAEALQAIDDLDLDELAVIEPPRGFGRD